MHKRNLIWWKRRSGFEGGLTVVVVSRVFLCIALAVGEDQPTTKPKPGWYGTRDQPAFWRNQPSTNRRHSWSVVGFDKMLVDPVSHNELVGIMVGFFRLERAIKVVIAKMEMLPSTAEALVARPLAEDVQTVCRQAGIEDVCLSPECIHTASTVLKNMDSDVEPCDDFYRFACGGFLKSTFIPDDEDNVDAFTVLKDKLQKQLRATMKEPSEPNELKSFRLVKNLYKSCMNETAIEDQGQDPLHKILKKLGGWPVLDGEMWNEADFDWISSTYKFRDAGYSVDYLFTFRSMVDWKNEKRRVITLDTADLGIYYEYLLEGVDNEYVKAYYSFMVDIAVLLGAERERASIELKESLLFEINLANISLTFTERMNASLSYNLMTLDELTNNYPSIPWRQYFGKILPKDIIVEENEVVLVNVPSFMSDLEKLLCKTPKRIQANYVIWRAVKDSVSYLNDDIRKRELVYWTARGIETEGSSRLQECIDLITERLPVAVGAMYVRKYFNTEAKPNVVDIVVDIRQQFYKIIQQVEWMDAKTRQSTLEKATAIFNYVAYPDELLNDTKLEKFYEKLELSGGNYLDSMLNLTFFDLEYSFSKLREPVNKNNWVSLVSPAVVTAAHGRYGNNIQFPAAILQGQFFGSDRPKYMNYGSIGFGIAHEIAHAFDYMEFQFDKDGNLVDWPNENYLKRVECIIHQYGNYTVEEVGLELNAMQTKFDNIADNAGMKVAYRAYNDWAERNKPEQKLPGLPYSPNQMFWIAAANLWCAKWKPEALKRYIETNVHSPQEFRILGSVSNMPEFSKDFNCSIGSKMNPEKKCSVW